MDQIEKPLSILLIAGAIAYAFMFHAGDGYAAIENNTDSGYAVNAADLNSGYNVTGANSDEGYNVDVQQLDVSDNLACDSTSVDSLIVNIAEEAMEAIEGDNAEIIIEAEVTEE